MRVREKLTQRWRRDDAVGHTIRRARGEEILWPLRAAADVENVAAREDSERSYNERLEMEMEAVEDEVKRKHTGDDSSSMEAVHHESEQRWLLHHRFRTVLLGLLWASSSTTAAMLLVPGILSGCDADSLAVVPILLVLVVVPAFLFCSNSACHHYCVSYWASKLLLLSLVICYYLPIVYFDSQTKAMVGENAPACTRLFDRSATVMLCTR